MRNGWVVCAAWLALTGCKSAPAASGGTTPTAIGPALDTSIGKQLKADPGATLIALERDVWKLEGRLLAEADAALEGSAARAALGDPERALRENGAEARVRAYLRTQRSPETRQAALAFLGALTTPTRALLEEVARKSALSPEDVLMDYLTYEGIFDLAVMRYGYRRWKAGRTVGAAKATADSFFANTTALPAARRGISVVAATDNAIEVDVFGARVHEQIERTEVVYTPGAARRGVVEWTSPYESLRQTMRGQDVKPVAREELEFDGAGYRLSYAVELEEYVTWNATNPWAATLYALSPDDVADLYAGVAAAGGLEGGPAAAGDPAELPVSGVVGTAASGLKVTVEYARTLAGLAGLKPRHGQFVLVAVTVVLTLKSEIKAPAEWFALSAGGADYPEIGVSRPGLGALLVVLGQRDERPLSLPFTKIPAWSTNRLLLLYDVPAGTKLAALRVGAEELALKVDIVTPPAGPAGVGGKQP